MSQNFIYIDVSEILFHTFISSDRCRIWKHHWRWWNFLHWLSRRRLPSFALHCFRRRPIWRRLHLPIWRRLRLPIWRRWLPGWNRLSRRIWLHRCLSFWRHRRMRDLKRFRCKSMILARIPLRLRLRLSWIGYIAFSFLQLSNV